MKDFVAAAIPRTRRTTALIVVFGLLMACGQVDMSHYRGDGQIVPIGKGIIRGYKVEFDRIDLSRPFSKTYRIIDYPLIGKGKGLNFGLEVRAKETDLDEILGGILSYRLSTFESVEIFHCADELRNWRHSELYMNKNNVIYEFYCMTDGKKTYFDPEETAHIPGLNRLYLDVQYDPHGTRKRIKGVIELEAGGTK